MTCGPQTLLGVFSTLRSPIIPADFLLLQIRGVPASWLLEYVGVFEGDIAGSFGAIIPLWGPS